jgi:hypothetical protein
MQIWGSDCLQDALAVQKSVQERRLQQHGTAAKIQLWIDQELEVLVSTVDAERTLEQLLEDRAMLHGQLDQLKVKVFHLCIITRGYRLYLVEVWSLIVKAVIIQLLYLSFKDMAKSFRTGHVACKPDMMQLCGARWHCDDLLWISVMGAAVTECYVFVQLMLKFVCVQCVLWSL